MTTDQKKTIINLRSKGMSYKEIANIIEIPKEAVRSFCRNHIAKGEYCPQCGNPVTQVSGRKRMRFCSAECRQAWWNAHPEAVRQKAIYSYVCVGCGCPFTAYGNAHRKYCSHACYIQARYKERDAS